MVVVDRHPTTPPTQAQAAARLLTELLAPAPVASLLLIVVAWPSAANGADAVRWGLIAALFVGLVPMAYILGQVRRQRLTDA